MQAFKEKIRDYQIRRRNTYLLQIKEDGRQNGKNYQHILPWKERLENFYEPIRAVLFNKNNGYLEKNKVTPHSGIHNLLSSWVLCVNMYWPFNNSAGYEVLAAFLREQTGIDIREITDMELEYEECDVNFKPQNLLGENSGKRGSGQTSPDLAIKFKTADERKGIILFESKFTEESFYMCSGYKKRANDDKLINPDRNRCLNTTALVNSNFCECHLTNWHRRYWDLLEVELNKSKFIELNRCPMSCGCYQLFRQGALAKGLSNKYDIIISGVVTDQRNDKIKKSGRSTGMAELPTGWNELFPNMDFVWISHNDWYLYVKENNALGEWSKWLAYVGERYFY